MPKIVIVGGVSTSTNAGAKSSAGEANAPPAATSAHPVAAGVAWPPKA